jgi:hypothetical protein
MANLDGVALVVFVVYAVYADTVDVNGILPVAAPSSGTELTTGIINGTTCSRVMRVD